MAIVRWNPYSEIESFRRQFDQIFNDSVHSYAATSSWRPAIEVHEAEDRFILKAQLPGFEAKDLDINATRKTVVIKGEAKSHQEDGNKLHYSEFHYGAFERGVKLPVAIQNDKIHADFNNGILTLTLPKVEDVVNRVVKVNLGANEPQVEAANEEKQAN